MFKPTGFSESIFKDRYAFSNDETWEEACERVARQMASCERHDKIEETKQMFLDILINNYFCPGGRIWYGSGRPHPNVLNCFVISDDLDSKEGWGNAAYEMIVTSMSGGGVGIDFSNVRPKGATINGQRGLCPGPIELMKLVNNCADPIRAGGTRRCLPKGTLVHTKRGLIRIEEVSVSDEVQTSKGYFKVLNNFDQGEQETIIINTKIGTLECTGNHRVAVITDVHGNYGWKLAKDLTNEDSLLYTQGYCKDIYSNNESIFSPIEVISLSKGRIVQTYDLEVENNHEFIANGYLVHNSALMFSLDLTHPDVVDFLNVKLNLNELTNSNISVKVRDMQEFVNAVKNDGFLNLEWKGKYKKEVKARKIWDIISENAYNKAEPGLLNWDLAESENTVYYNSKLSTCNPCLTGETLVYVADGRGNVKIKDLADEGKDIDVFCYDNNGKIKIRKMRNPRVTGYNQKIYKVTLDDGSTIRTTENHKFLTLNDGYKEVKDLKSGDSLNYTTDCGDTLENLGSHNDGYETRIEDGILKVKKICEKCSNEFWTTRREVGFCSVKCYDGYLNRSQIQIDAEKTLNYKVSSVEFDGYETVYNGTVDEFHNFFVGGFEGKTSENKGKLNYINNLNCGEITLPCGGSCCLGHLVLPRFVNEGNLQWDILGDTIRAGVRFLDNVLDVNHFPLDMMKDIAMKYRRIGLGTTGLADMLILLGYRYGSAEGNEFLDKLFRFISKQAYEASIMLAIEKGMFPSCDKSLHLKSGYVKRMTPKIKSLIKEYGIRNCAILTQAPVGTGSILSGNISSGIEPIMAAAYQRRYWQEDVRMTEEIFHPLFVEYMKAGKDVSHFISAKDLDIRNHFEVQKVIQKHIDNAISKTINIAEDFPLDKMKEIWLEYLPYLKGTTFYRENSRQFVDKDGNLLEPPIVPYTLEESIAKYRNSNEKEIVEGSEEQKCKSGVCEL